MITAEEAEMNREIYSRSRYGHLMDKYINADSHPEFCKDAKEYIRMHPKLAEDVMDIVEKYR